MPTTTLPRPATSSRLWAPKRVMITAAAAEQPHTAEIIRRCLAAGVDDIQTLSGQPADRPRPGQRRETYARAKSTLAVVVAPPSDGSRSPSRPAPTGGSTCPRMSGPLPVLLPGGLVDRAAGHPGLRQPGRRTGRHRLPRRPRHRDRTSADRAHEGTTFELSCYTDPLGMEHLTGSLATAIRRVGAGHFGTDVSLRFTTKYDGVGTLLGLDHRGRTRVRFSINAAEVDGQVRGRHRAAAGSAGGPGSDGASRLPGRSDHRAGDAGPRLARTGTRHCSTTWQPRWTASPDLDLTAEIITHRFTPGSKEVLLGWYPRTKLEMDEERRSQKRRSSAASSTSTRQHDGASCGLVRRRAGRRLPAARSSTGPEPDYGCRAATWRERVARLARCGASGRRRTPAARQP